MSDYEQSLISSIYHLKYENVELVKADVLKILTEFTDLEHAEDTFVYEDGYRKKLLKLKGIVPVHFAGSDYRVPVSIWLSKRHPFRPPIVYVSPSSRMHVMSGNFVDMNGKVNMPYLTDWDYPRADLLSLVQVMITIFSEELPIRGKSISTTFDMSQNSGATCTLPPEGGSPGVSSDSVASFDLSDEVHGRRRSRESN